MHDYHSHPCLCCEQQFKRSQVAEVDVQHFKETNVWLRIVAYAILTNPDFGQDPVYLCHYCRPKVKNDIMPGRCVLNGLQTASLPDELKGLDPFSSQLIQLAKAFQTVVRLGTYLNKVPSHNSLKACKGNMFVLPLPLEKSLETLEQSESGLAKPELYVIVDGMPTKKKVVWRSFVDIAKVKAAVAKLKEINWLYGNVKPDDVEKSTEDLVIEVANSATSTVLEKVSDKDDYSAGLQAYTIRHLDKPAPSGTDIDHFKMVNVDEYPLKCSQVHLDLMCFPDLFPTGEFGEHHYREVHLSNARVHKI